MGPPVPDPDAPAAPAQAEPPAPPPPAGYRADRPRPRQAHRQPVPVAGATALTVQPGQTLIVILPDTPDAERAGEIAASLKERLPGVEVLVLGGVRQIAVYDPEGGA